MSSEADIKLQVEELQAENRSLREELIRIQNWPDGMDATSPGIYGSVSAWRERALVAERKLIEAYARLRLLNEERMSRQTVD